MIGFKEFFRSPLTMQKRVALLLLAATGNGMYLLLNRIMSGGIAPKQPIDDLIPLWPIWTIPYLLELPWWVGMGIWFLLKMEDRRYMTAIAAALILLYGSALVFAVYPTYVIRPEVAASNPDTALVYFLYHADKAYNALPRLHMGITTLLVLICWDWQPKLRLVWAAMIPLTIFSTLFTRQHYVLDLVAGMIWATISLLTARWWASRWSGIPQ